MRVSQGFLFMVFFVSVFLGIWVSPGQVNIFHFSLLYKFAAFFLLLGAFFLLLKKSWVKHLRPFYYIFFLALWLMPFLRCRFKVPFLFCHACPGKCAWGFYRSSFIPVFLALNLDRRFWCWRLCPLGQIQDKVFRGSGVSVPAQAGYLRYVVLLFTVLVLALGLSHTYKAAYVYSALSLGLLFFLLGGSFFVRRSFCTYLCPVGAFSDLVLEVENKAKK
ncbi:MAG: 4Fe-4S binding protein [Candidatus Altiarchaeales archaeon]|nr:4Fe-4S binding protein [Candidatus Altiarchaeales archaeon]